MSGLHNKQPAFTLIEIIMVIVLLAIVGTTTAMLIGTGTESFSDMQTRGELTDKGRLAVERMTRELRLMNCADPGGGPPSACEPDGTVITTSTATEVAFVNINNDAVGFRLNGTNIEIRLDAGDYVLADNAAAFNIDYLDDSGATTATVGDMWAFEVTFTLASGTESLDFTARVHPRSFR